MLIDRYQPEDVFARVPEPAAQTDPVLKQTACACSRALSNEPSRW
jgi:hypothetical protein